MVIKERNRDLTPGHAIDTEIIELIADTYDREGKGDLVTDLFTKDGVPVATVSPGFFLKSLPNLEREYHRFYDRAEPRELTPGQAIDVEIIELIAETFFTYDDENVFEGKGDLVTDLFTKDGELVVTVTSCTILKSLPYLEYRYNCVAHPSWCFDDYIKRLFENSDRDRNDKRKNGNKNRNA